MSAPPVVRLPPLPASFAATVAALHRGAEQIVAPGRKPDLVPGGRAAALEFFTTRNEALR